MKTKRITKSQMNELTTTFQGIMSNLGRVPTLEQVKAEADVPSHIADAWWAGDFEAGSSDDPT